MSTPQVPGRHPSFCKLNEVTVKDSYPLPRIDDCLDALAGCRLFSTLDLCSGYWQVAMSEEDKPKTAFSTGNGLYQFTVMRFGLCNAPATFERLMEKVLSGLPWEVCFLYLDDVIVHFREFGEAIKRLCIVLQQLRDAGLKLSPKKCILPQQSVPFLGHVVSNRRCTYLALFTDSEGCQKLSGSLLLLQTLCPWLC